MIFKNKELREMASEIAEKGIEFKKGTVSGHSIEIVENDPESFTSFTYYEDEAGRDSDFNILAQLKQL